MLTYIYIVITIIHMVYSRILTPPARVGLSGFGGGWSATCNTISMTRILYATVHH